MAYETDGLDLGEPGGQWYAVCQVDGGVGCGQKHEYIEHGHDGGHRAAIENEQ